MKYIYALIFFCGTYILTTSCERMFGDYLDKAPGVDITIDTLFSSRADAEIFLASCYEQGMIQGYPNASRYIGNESASVSRFDSWNESNAFHWACSCDEAKNPVGWYFSNIWNQGGMNVTRAVDEDRPYPVRWNAIRYAYLMLENIDKVKDINDQDPDYSKKIKAEMHWLIALNYFEMVKRYGGVPIVRKAFKITDAISSWKIPRASLDSTFNFIVENINAATPDLPDAWPTNWKGRITKGACLALKAKTLLYKASPLFNTGTPYLSMNNPDDNRLICLGNYDVNRWQEAADAAKAVLDWAPAGGVSLVTDKGVDKNYQYVWEVMDNPEIIIAEKLNNGGTKTPSASMPWATIFPPQMGGWTGVCPTQTFVENFYDKRDGTPQTWEPTATNLNQKYAELDYRFKQTIGYNGSYWNSRFPVLETFKPNGLHQNTCLTGYWMKKFIPEAQQRTNSNIPVNWPIFRLAEAYLTYAEALNEANPTPPLAAYNAVNDVRARSGMPPLPTGLSQAQFRDRIRKEWGVEFAFEDHRFWDIRRWLIAENPSVMQGPMTGLTITKFGSGTPQQFQYVRYTIETRVWNRYTYLHPFTTTEVNKGYIIQNPGY